MTNVEVIQQLYRCFREKDDEGFRRICADDVEWIQNVGFPHGAVHSGANAVIEGVFRGNRREWDDSPIASRRSSMPGPQWR